MYNAEALIMESKQYAPTTEIKIRVDDKILDCLGLGHEVVNGKMCIVLESVNSEEAIQL